MRPRLALYRVNLDGRKKHGHEIGTYIGTVEVEARKIALEVKNQVQVEKIEVVSS